MTSEREQGCCGGASTALTGEDAATIQAEEKDSCGCKSEAREIQAAHASSEPGTRGPRSERKGRCC